jgi:thiosulfate dehydrogenase [quinone] large subunit
MFIGLAANPTMLAMVDFINSWGLVLIGLGIMVGAFATVFSIAAAVLLFLYYIAAPPFVGLVYSVPMEGSYLIVNKVLIELVAVLVLLAFPTSMSFGLDRLIFWKKTQESQATA